MRAYNQKVRYHNRRGGATKSVARQLNIQKQKLDKQRALVNSYRKKVMPNIRKLNALANKINRLTRKYNYGVLNYRSMFGGSRKFNQGVYIENTAINVYHFYERSDLILIIAHEMGHAIGIDHVSNPKSIMYYLMSDQEIGRAHV